MKSHFTDRVAGRAAIARALQQPGRAQLIQALGLLPADLLTIQSQGEEAEKQDRASWLRICPMRGTARASRAGRSPSALGDHRAPAW